MRALIPVAAVVYRAAQGRPTDALLCEVAASLRAQGYRLAGTVQWNPAAIEGVRCDMELEDLATGRRYDTSQNRRTAPQTCRLDASALEDVAGIVANSIHPEVDLIIVNRFGKQEISGAGFRNVIEAAVTAEIPLLTAVNEAHRAEWEAFAAGHAVALAPEPAAVLDWCRFTLNARANPSQPALSP